jgi:two-component sensor histidine kinase
LSEELSGSIFADHKLHTITINADEADMPMDRATVLGLIVNELVTNAVKYAHSEDKAAPVAVDFRVTDNGYELSVTDEGPGLPPGFDAAASTGLGMRLIRSLVSQIGGEIGFEGSANGHGTRAVVRFS